MRRPIVFTSIALSLALAASLVVVWAANRESKTKPKQVAKPLDKANTQARPIPEHLMYWHLFEHKVLLDRKAEEAEKQGRSGEEFRAHYKNSAKLNEREAEILASVAKETYDKVTAQDAKAKALIDKLRAKGLDGTVKPGQTNPEVPAELKALQKERDEMVMTGVKKLREGFGPEGAGVFDSFVKEHVGQKFTNLMTITSPHNFDPRTDPRIQQMFKDSRRAK
jgi:uncharacterized protein YdbL (DUF1318 family)